MSVPAPPAEPQSGHATIAQSLRFSAALGGVALAAAAFAVMFRSSLSFALVHAAGTASIVQALHDAPWWVRLGLPALGGLAAGLVGLLVARDATGHGVGDVMEAVVLGRVHLSMRATLLKSLGSWLAISAGGSVGREGPLIRFGGAAGKFLGDLARLPPDRVRVLIAAGTAAGFAAAYDTPFAAVLFVLEVVTGIVVLDTIVPVLIATVIATALVRGAVGATPLYGARAFVIHSAIDLGAFALLGVVSALAAQGFMRLLAFGETVFRRPRLRPPWRSALGGLAAGAILVAIPEVAGNGYEPLTAVLDGRLPVLFVAGLLLAKSFATTASVSSGNPGGVFTPTLLLGGALGFVFGSGLSAVFGVNVGPVGGYALVGMAAMIAATTHAPLLAAVMAFELSGDYALVLPLVLATALATLVSRRLRRDSIYGAELRERGVGWELTLDGRRVANEPPA